MTCYCSILKSTPLFADLNPVQLNVIAQICSHHIFPGETVLFHPNDQGGNLYLVLRGGVKISTGVSGEENVIGLISEGESFGEMSLFTCKTQTSTAVAISDENEILILSQKDLRKALVKNHDLTEHLLFVFANRLEKCYQNRPESGIEFVSHSSLARVARLLLARSNADNGALSSHLSQEEIARYIGVRRETVARNLARLEASECLSRNRGRLVVLDRARLWRVAKSA